MSHHNASVPVEEDKHQLMGIHLLKELWGIDCAQPKVEEIPANLNTDIYHTPSTRGAIPPRTRYYRSQ